MVSYSNWTQTYTAEDRKTNRDSKLTVIPFSYVAFCRFFRYNCSPWIVPDDLCEICQGFLHSLFGFTSHGIVGPCRDEMAIILGETKAGQAKSVCVCVWKDVWADQMLFWENVRHWRMKICNSE